MPAATTLTNPGEPIAGSNPFSPLNLPAPWLRRYAPILFGARYGYAGEILMMAAHATVCLKYSVEEFWHS
jgi:hypothetical protein